MTFRGGRPGPFLPFPGTNSPPKRNGVRRRGPPFPVGPALHRLSLASALARTPVHRKREAQFGRLPVGGALVLWPVGVERLAVAVELGEHQRLVDPLHLIL